MGLRAGIHLPTLFLPILENPLARLRVQHEAAGKEKQMQHKDSTGWPIIVGARVKVTPPHPSLGEPYKATVVELEKPSSDCEVHIKLRGDYGTRWTYPSWVKVLRSGPKRKRLK